MISLLVTGGCGFIGSNFINYIFDETKYKIVNLDAMYYCAAETNIEPHIRAHPTHYKFIKGNLCAEDLVNYILENHQITHVIHFAAQSHVQNSFEDSIQFTHDNILGTHTLLEVCKRYGKIEKFIHVSTDEVYGESMLSDEDAQKKTEQSILCPTNPYAATKAGAELIAQAYYHSFKFPVIITRGNNVYGPNQYPEKLIPKFIEQLSQNKPVTIQGDGSCMRAFLHASDAAKAFEVILSKGQIGEIYNIGCHQGMEYSVLEIAHKLIKKIKKIPDQDANQDANQNTTESEEKIKEWIKYVEDRPFNDTRYYISNQKLLDLGWKIEKDFETGIDELIHE